LITIWSMGKEHGTLDKAGKARKKTPKVAKMEERWITLAER
jgi:ribosomal protein S30